jgi:hydroxyacylglutathione hydrolase
MPELIPGVHQVGNHPLDCASYLVLDEYDGNHIMIESGSRLGYQELIQDLGALGVAASEVAGVYVTHGHKDHYEGVTKMPHEPPLFVHAADTKAIRTGDRDLTAAFLYEGKVHPYKNVQGVGEGAAIRVGSTTIAVYDMPGHTPGSVDYVIKNKQGQRLWITGDTAWGGYSKRINSRKKAWRQSLDRQVQLAQPTDSVTFGHGIQRAIPNAKEHFAMMRSHFWLKVVPSHGGLYYDPWASSHTPAPETEPEAA